MAVEEKEDFKGQRKRGVKDVSEVHERRSENWMDPIPPNVTVDDLWFYRKGRNIGLLKDNLKVQEGSFKHLKSEYRRRFKNFYEALKSSLNGKDLLDIEKIIPEASLKLEGAQEHQSEYNESFGSRILQRANALSEELLKDVSDYEAINRENQIENIPRITVIGSPGRHLNRRPTNLKLEGDFYHLTEHAEKFIEYLLVKRAELCRTPTTLKLGTGEMETKTETTDQFIKYDKMERPSLCRKFTNLHLEGDLDIKTEKQEKFVPFDVKPRPPLKKKSTNLHLEGDHSLIPEYRHQYVQYQNPVRSGPILPLHNLKSARLFEDNSNEDATFGRRTPLIPFLRESYSHHDLEDKQYRRSNSFSRSQSNVSLNRTSSHPNLVKSAISDERKRISKTPQKNAYLDFDRSQNMSLDRKRTKKGSTVVNSVGDGKFFGEPEYRSAFTDFPRERPRVRRPQSNFTNEGKVNYLTENEEKYKEYKPIEKTQFNRRKSGQIFDDPFDKQIDGDPAFDGPFECQPEYRKAYIDYLVREKPPQGQRRRILEIPNININDETVIDIETSNPNDNIKQTETTSKEERPKSSKQKPSSSSSSVPSSPKILSSSPKILFCSPKIISPSGSKKITPKEDTDKRQRVFPRSLTPSPVPPEKPKTPSPRFKGNWRRHQFRESVVTGTNKGTTWNSMEADPAFFVLDDRQQSRSSIRNDLYKEQRWMPAWYNGEQ
ncbi:unnamed protein product [Psylliodes chrysocephalus]|uniref:Uncharacterized protein n=1 Tax=Psylliodes chrysocephalus TaxID=3402493 RepID=A0A9P0GD27_9CUCU|nr:unnamed protein product [Psylliodes chrysocephala]